MSDKDRFENALEAIAGADGSWDVIGFAEDVLADAYDPETSSYPLDVDLVVTAVEQLLVNETRRVERLRDVLVPALSELKKRGEARAA